MKKLVISITLSILLILNSIMPAVAYENNVNNSAIINLAKSSYMEISIGSDNSEQIESEGDNFSIKQYYKGKVINLVQGVIGGRQIFSTSLENGQVKSKKSD